MRLFLCSRGARLSRKGFVLLDLIFEIVGPRETFFPCSIFRRGWFFREKCSSNPKKRNAEPPSSSSASFMTCFIAAQRERGRHFTLLL
jgi:hypothetical protein